MHEIIDMDLDDSDFEPGTDRELLGLFFPEVRITFFGFLATKRPLGLPISIYDSYDIQNVLKSEQSK